MLYEYLSLLSELYRTDTSAKYPGSGQQAGFVAWIQLQRITHMRDSHHYLARYEKIRIRRNEKPVEREIEEDNDRRFSIALYYDRIRCEHTICCMLLKNARCGDA